MIPVLRIVPIVGMACGLFALHAANAQARIHSTADLSIEAKGQTAIVMFKDGVQRLYLKPSVSVDGSGDVAWVIPVPKVPHEHKIANDVFVSWVGRSLAITKMRQDVHERNPKSSKELAEEQELQVGGYQIQAFDSRGDKAASELTEWLEAHDFSAPDPALIEYYVVRSWSFVTVKTTLKGTTSADERGDELPAIALEFATSHPVVPLRMTAHRDGITFKAWFLSDRELEEQDFSHAYITYGLEVAADRRKKSDWSSISDTWVLAQGSVYFSQIREDPGVLFELEKLYPEAKQLWIYGVAGKVTPDSASAASEELYFGPPNSSLDMAEVKDGRSRHVDESVKLDAPADGEESPVVDDRLDKKLSQPGSTSEIDWTTVIFVLAVVFALTAFVSVKFMRRG